MKMLLTSGGIKNHAIVKALTHLVGKDLQEASMLFVPTAANTDDGDKSWLVQNIVEFQHCEFKSFDMVDIAGVAPEVWKKRFENVDIICFGGGNEKYLAKIFEELGMKEFLATLPENKVYMGVSAGSMVTGHFMTNELYDLTYSEEEFYGKVTNDPMKLYNFCFLPHLNSPYFGQMTKENLLALKDKFTCTLYAVDEDTAMTIEGAKMEMVGGGECVTIIK